MVRSEEALAIGLAFLSAVNTGVVRPGTFNRSASVAVLTFTIVLVAVGEVVGEPAFALVIVGVVALGAVVAGLVVTTALAIVVAGLTAVVTVATGGTTLAAVAAGGAVTGGVVLGVVVAVVSFGVVPQPARAATAMSATTAVLVRRCLKCRDIVRFLG